MQKKGQKQGQFKRGRKNLEIDSQILFDAFNELNDKSSKLSLYVDTSKGDNELRAFSKKDEYPYELGP
jgi:hypothetical protein